jgi:predicted Zn-dependent protease
VSEQGWQETQAFWQERLRQMEPQWDPTEPLSQRRIREMEALARQSAINPATDEALDFIAAWDKETIEFITARDTADTGYDALTELRRIRVGVYVIAAALLVCAFVGVMIALVLSARTN